MFSNRRNTVFIVAVVTVIFATIVICACAVSCSGGKLNFKTSYYYVCYRITDNSVSAGSLSGTVSSYGGAGYIIEHSGNYYVTVSCYYSNNDAETVCSGLKRRGLDCSVIKIQTDAYKLRSRAAKRNCDLYLGNLNTLNSLSRVAYECANGIDNGLNQSKAKETAKTIENSLKALLKSNQKNCFTETIEKLLAEYKYKTSGYLYSKDMRYLQIAITDAIIKAELY